MTRTSDPGGDGPSFGRIDGKVTAGSDADARAGLGGCS